MIQGLHSSISKSILENFKITNFTEVQALSFPIINAKKNLIALAETGSGKTIAYLAPLLSSIEGSPKNPIKILVITPTKELAEQTLKTAKKLSQFTQLISYSIYGGKSFREQELDIKKGKHVIIACPGRLVDHIEKSTIDLSGVEAIVLDECDQLFDLGFLPHLKIILNAIPTNSQRLLFSATMSDEIKELAQESIREAEMINVQGNKPKEIIEEYFCPISHDLRYPFIRFLLKNFKMKSAILFCNTKEQARVLYDYLKSDQVKAAILEGDMTTHQRKKSLQALKDKSLPFLISTDVAARGLDIPHVKFIINLEPPLYSESYIHRMGRSARHDNNGSVFTLYRPESSESERLEKIASELKLEIKATKIKEFNYSLKIDNKNRRII